MLAYPAIGQVVGGKYRIVRILGEGGMGIVLEAVNITTGKRVALKWMHPHVSADPVAAERLLREAQVAARVRHPNVIDIYDVDRHENSLFLVMEYLEGESLRSLLQRGTATGKEILGLLIGAMRGAAEAHKRGVIHRDIKPENIFLSVQGNDPKPVPKLLDFGISKLALLDVHQLPLTKTGSTFGTPVYMSYEQLSGESDLDVRTDIYSFGVVLYEALTGRLPYEAETFPAVIMKIATEPPLPLREHNPSMPVGLERVIMNALRKEREKRMPSVDSLRSLLEPFLEDGSLRRALGPPVSNPDRSVDRRKSFTAPASGLAHSTFPKMLERALHMRVVVVLSGLALFVALAVIAYKLSTSAPIARVPAKAPAIAALPSSKPPSLSAQSRPPSALPTDALSLQPRARADSPAQTPPMSADTSAATSSGSSDTSPPSSPPVARRLVTPARGGVQRSKIKIAEFGLASESGRRKRVETPRLDEF
jgi:serine/threonine protein kinase